MLNLSKPQEFNCLASYVLEMVNAVKLEQLKPFFDFLPASGTADVAAGPSFA